jgi:hypothetical protein
MGIEGPLKFSIISYDDSDDREIHVVFKEEFQKLELQEQAIQFADHVNSLRAEAASLKEGSEKRAGMLFVLQFLEELVPHIQAGAVPLDEAIVVKLQDEQSPLSNIISGLKH